jgi:hypothetical protein
MRLRLSVVALAVLLALPALASPAIQLVPRGGDHKRMETTVTTKGANISTTDFAAAILDCANYPLTASYMGVKALVECRTIDKRPDGMNILYQRTGGNSLIASRHWVIGIRTTEMSDQKVRIEWDLVQHEHTDAGYTGPYAAALNAHPDAVYTPYCTGGWVYDKAAGTISYYTTSDPGGTVPGWLVSQSSVMAFPLELLKTRWGVVP